MSNAFAGLGSMPLQYPWVAALHERAESLLGVTLGDMLGCGWNGCVFAAGEQRTVKFTRDPREVLLKQIALEEHLHGVLPVFQIVKLSDDLGLGEEANEAWGILQARVVPLTEADWDDATLRPYFMLTAEARNAWIPGRAAENRTTVSEAKRRYAATVRTLRKTLSFPDVVGTIEYLLELDKVYVADVAPNNMGRLPNGRVVLFDGQAFRGRKR